MESFAVYSHALAALAGWGLLTMILSGLSTRGRNADNRAECGLPKRNYAEASYRAHRAYANAMESTTPFLTGTVVCILAGAAPFWVNLFASVFLVARIAMAYVHIAHDCIIGNHVILMCTSPPKTSLRARPHMWSVGCACWCWVAWRWSQHLRADPWITTTWPS